MIRAQIESLNPSLVEYLAEFYCANESRLAAILTESQQSRAFKLTGYAIMMAILVFSMLQGGMLLTRVKGDVAERLIMLSEFVP